MRDDIETQTFRVFPQPLQRDSLIGAGSNVKRTTDSSGSGRNWRRRNNSGWVVGVVTDNSGWVVGVVTDNCDGKLPTFIIHRILPVKFPHSPAIDEVNGQLHFSAVFPTMIGLDEPV
jgi:hypothetical protein